MLVSTEERIPLARLMKFMELGEHLAHDCAAAQARIAPDGSMRRFLRGQARQESVHAVAFQGAILWLAPRHLGTSPFLAPLERYRELIEDAVNRGDFYETLLAEQIILEGLGEAILHRIEQGLVKRSAPFQRLRLMLLHQEEAHHGFGLRTLERSVRRGEVSVEALQARVPEYLSLTTSMMLTVQDLFESINEDATAYVADVETCLPSWLTSKNSICPNIEDIPCHDPQS